MRKGTIRRYISSRLVIGIYIVYRTKRRISPCRNLISSSTFSKFMASSSSQIIATTSTSSKRRVVVVVVPAATVFCGGYSSTTPIEHRSDCGWSPVGSVQRGWITTTTDGMPSMRLNLAVVVLARGKSKSDFVCSKSVATLALAPCAYNVCTSNGLAARRAAFFLLQLLQLLQLLSVWKLTTVQFPQTL